MLKLRSSIVTDGKGAAHARALWRATGMGEGDFGKPIIAVANSFTQFVPGHIHLQDVGQFVCQEIEKAGGIGREFNTIAVDDGIVQGHDGSLYSLPSRDLIADSVEYMANAHKVDALVCISNCDKITPGMLLAAMRLNIPTIFVSGGPMEAGRVMVDGKMKRIDLVDAYVASMSSEYDDSTALQYEQIACPTCGSCSGMFTANSMNCLTEALGLALPGNGSMLATHSDRLNLFKAAGQKIVELAIRYYKDGDDSVLPRNIANYQAFENAMCVDIAMGGSTNTILHLLAAAQEGEIPFTMKDIDRLSKKVPYLCKVSPATHDFYMEDDHRAGGVIGLLGELDRIGLIHKEVNTIYGKNMGAAMAKWDIAGNPSEEVEQFYLAGPAGVRSDKGMDQESRWGSLDLDRANGCIRSGEHAYSKDGGLAILYGNIAEDGCVVKTGSVVPSMLKFTGKARVYEGLEETMERMGKEALPGDFVIIKYEGPRGAPGMPEMVLPTSIIKSMGLAASAGLITDGRFSGGTSGLSIGHVSPEAAAGGTFALIQDGDEIHVDIPSRKIQLLITEKELEERREKMNQRPDGGWKPFMERPRAVSFSLKAYALLATSADKGGVRDRNKLGSL